MFSVNNNLMEGNIPEYFANMPNLQNLDLYSNYFSGSIPAKLAQCDNWKIWQPHYDILPQNNGMLTIEENALYTSTDYSKDGEVFILQKHSIGNGVKLVLMGDFFVDTDMNPGGVYETKMKEAMEYYFSIEPFLSLREYFDVIGIKAVSKHNQINYESAFSTNTITLGSTFDSDKDKCMKFAQKAISNDNLDDVSVIMVLNVFSPYSQADLFGNNFSIAYCPLDEQLQTDKYMVNHEANGHGFGLLADEYLNGIIYFRLVSLYYKDMDFMGK